jgi:hypothetical protein
VLSALSGVTGLLKTGLIRISLSYLFTVLLTWISGKRFIKRSKNRAGYLWSFYHEVQTLEKVFRDLTREN